MTLLLVLAVLAAMLGGGLVLGSIAFNTRHKLVLIGSGSLSLALWLLLGYWLWVMI